ncbi:DUF1573 domain-containing protein [uncultured Fibrella sp.]|uniref:DUF1573 domain-containing protein n=1 Tax=uncultured Fibrella sp. TaxID=1284596 RepID=UPI0035CBA9F3
MCIGYLSCQSTSKNTKIVVNDYIDLGSVTIGDTVNFSIPLINPTDEYLKIVAVKGSCECITINTCPPGLEPTKNGTIYATYSSKFERKLAGVLYKSVVIKLDKKPFLHSVSLRVDIK